MQLIAVLDILNGQVVHGIAGQRQLYQPIRSNWTTSTDPVVVARSLLQHFPVAAIYIADLDAIQYQRRNFDLYEQLVQLPVPIWLDTGLRTAAEFLSLPTFPDLHLILATETLDSPAEIAGILPAWEIDKLILSLDFRHGVLLHPTERNPQHWLQQASSLQKRIVLDLAHVGTQNGLALLPQLQEWIAQYPQYHWITGAGIRHQQDWLLLQSMGVHGALLASALHQSQTHWLQ